MKTSIAFVFLLASVSLGFAQGKLWFVNDSTRLVYFANDAARLVPGDAAVAGKGLYDGTLGMLTDSPTLVVDLWAGTTASSLSKQRTATFGGVEGQWNAVNVIFPSLPAAVPAYFQIQVHDSRDADAFASASVYHYFGYSEVFTATPAVAIYAPIYLTTVPVYSTWAAGTFQVVDMPAGNFGAIEVSVVPEPGTLGLALLGAAALMIARRRGRQSRCSALPAPGSSG